MIEPLKSPNSRQAPRESFNDTSPKPFFRSLGLPQAPDNKSTSSVDTGNASLAVWPDPEGSRLEINADELRLRIENLPPDRAELALSACDAVMDAIEAARSSDAIFILELAKREIANRTVTQELDRVPELTSEDIAAIGKIIEEHPWAGRADDDKWLDDPRLAKGKISSEERGALGSQAISRGQTENERIVGEVKKRGRPNKKTLTPEDLPHLPNGLVWPTEKFGSSPEAHTRDGIVKYLDRVWRPLISSGYAEQRYVAILDPSVINGVTTYRRARGGIRQIPPHLRFLSYQEAKALRARAESDKVLQRINDKTAKLKP